ncbi:MULTISPECIES: MotE family protein [unclassified Roseitalea]|uniref:MotE family protein n=1 Tax=unclassified Roseitalea TaxID=2639107 RepID=UPI00273D7AC1|nr:MULTISPECIES: MotE family protein [unclassified Roseitalea]
MKADRTSAGRPADPGRRALAAGLAALCAGLPTAALSQSRAQSDIETFCANIADDARERRYAIQREQLEALRAEIEDKIALLEEKRADFERWARKREEFADAANEGLVEVYSNMRPDAAAARMEEMPAELSAALLAKLKPRSSAAILNEMNARQAALITQIMAAVGDTNLGG